MSCGRVFCGKCHREIEQRHWMVGGRIVKKWELCCTQEWIHRHDSSPVCEGAEVLEREESDGR